MASRKRLFEEYDDLGKATDAPCKAAKLHGLLTSLSPMRSGKYFEGYLSDETRSVRVVGFDIAQQRELEIHHDNAEPFALQNCKVQKSRYSDEMEVMQLLPVKLRMLLLPRRQLTLKPLTSYQTSKTISTLVWL